MDLHHAKELAHIDAKFANLTAKSCAAGAGGLALTRARTATPDRGLFLVVVRGLAPATRPVLLGEPGDGVDGVGDRRLNSSQNRPFPGQLLRPGPADGLHHWDRVGDWTQQRLNLRYVVTRLLVRLGVDADAVALHHALVKARKPSPLGAAQLADLADRMRED
jgi:hypothetical protein